MKNLTCKHCGHTRTISEPEVKKLDIISIVADHFQVQVSKLFTHERTREIATARHIAMYMLRKKRKLTFTHIGNMFNRDHSTAIHSFHTVEDLMFSDPKIKTEVLMLNKKCSPVL